ncbi:MAG: hypothetical protein HY962_03575 [Ignavibacteriae bacterium]|nr:hypothetical protein [Ignavibacteriota bacterium]
MSHLHERFRRARTAYALALFAALLPVGIHAQPSQWTLTGPGGGGAFYLPSISPHNPAIQYVGSDMSGAYRSVNAGRSWTMLPHTQLQGGNTGARVAFTSDPAVLYAVTTAHDLRVPVKSLDAGQTWSALASDPTGGGVYSIWADPASTQRVLLSDYTRLYFSNDGGATFSQKFSSNTNGSGCHIGGVHFEGSNIWIGTNAGLLLSTNSGQTFALTAVSGIPAAQSIVSFAGGSSNGITRFVAVTLGVNDVYAGVTGAEYANFEDVYVLQAGQNTWIPANNGISGADYPFFAGMASNDANIMYLAGGSDGNAPIVYRSTNGGQVWTPVFLTGNNQNINTAWCGSGGDRAWSYPEYALGFAVGPRDASTLMFTDLGCVHVSSNGGQSWAQAYVDPRDENPAGSPTPTGRAYRSNGLEDTSVWWLAWTDPQKIFAGYTDIRGVLSTDGGVSWSFNYTGHTNNTMYCVVKHPGSGNLYAATSSIHDLYQSTYLQDSRIDVGAGRVLFSTNGGSVWQTLHDFQHPVVWVALDPANPNRLYASVVHSSAGGIYVSSNIQLGAASTWARLASPPRTQGHPLAIHLLRDGSLLCTYSGRRAGSPLAFTNSSGVFLSSDGGATWSDRSGPSMVYWTKDISIDPADATQSTWYAGVFGGWGGPPNGLGGLYKTVNRGTTWIKVFDNNYVEGCAFPPAQPGAMYVMTEQDGLWHTTNRNAATPVFTQLAAFPFRHPLRMFFAPLDSTEMWVTTFGGGLWYSGGQKVPVELTSFAATAEREGVRLRWTTESETNCLGFDIERRVAAENGVAPGAWMVCGARAGQGTSTARHDYEYFDNTAPGAGLLDYRLKQIDADGAFQYSRVLTLAREAPLDLRIRHAEIHNRRVVELVLEAPFDATVTMRLVALDGRVLAQQTVSCRTGIQTLNMPLGTATSGVYIVTAEGGGRAHSTRVVLTQ